MGTRWYYIAIAINGFIMVMLGVHSQLELLKSGADSDAGRIKRLKLVRSLAVIVTILTAVVIIMHLMN